MVSAALSARFVAINGLPDNGMVWFLISDLTNILAQSVRRLHNVAVSPDQFYSILPANSNNQIVKHRGKGAQMGERRKFGRPAGLPGSVRSHRVVTFVTDQELHKLNKLADARDKSLSSIVHDLVLLGFKHMKAPAKKEE